MKTKAKELWKIRPLKWDGRFAKTALGLFDVIQEPNEVWSWSFRLGIEFASGFRTEEQAKTHCEKWYRSQVKKTLIRSKP